MNNTIKFNAVKDMSARKGKLQHIAGEAMRVARMSTIVSVDPDRISNETLNDLCAIHIMSDQDIEFYHKVYKQESKNILALSGLIFEYL